MRSNLQEPEKETFALLKIGNIRTKALCLGSKRALLFCAGAMSSLVTKNASVFQCTLDTSQNSSANTAHNVGVKPPLFQKKYIYTNYNNDIKKSPKKFESPEKMAFLKWPWSEAMNSLDQIFSECFPRNAIHTFASVNTLCMQSQMQMPNIANNIMACVMSQRQTAVSSGSENSPCEEKKIEILLTNSKRLASPSQLISEEKLECLSTSCETFLSWDRYESSNQSKIFHFLIEPLCCGKQVKITSFLSLSTHSF